MKQKYTFKFGSKELPERREIKPIGRIVLLGKELSAKETKNYTNYIKANLAMK